MPRKIPRALTARYNRALKRSGDLAAQAVRSSLNEYFGDNPNFTVAEAREFASEMAAAAAELYGGVCSQAAFELQDEIAREFGAEPPELDGWYYQPDGELVNDAAHYQAGKLDASDVPGFVEQMAEVARFHAERGANETMIQTARRQDSSSRRGRGKGKGKDGMRFARVPNGPSCGFCIMLASRGFVYLTEETAGEMNQFHRFCDCRIVPGYKGMELEGYEYEKMYDAYKACRETVEYQVSDPGNPGRTTNSLRRDFNRLTREEQLSYADEKGNNAYNRYVARRITAEMDTRDRQWLYDGKPLPEPEKEEGAKPKGKELDTEEVLRGKGFRVRFRKEMEGGRTSDIYFLSGAANSQVATQFEFKCPEGSSHKAVKNQLKKTVGVKGKELQCERVVISNVACSLSFEDMCEQLESLNAEHRFPEIKEVLIVDRSGRMRRYKR